MTKREGKTFVVLFIAALFFAGGKTVQAGNPVGDFFKRLGNSIAHPNSAKPHRQPPRAGVARAPTAKPSNNPTQPEPSPNSAGAGTTAAPASAPLTIQRGQHAPPGSGRRDLPYGLPVPNKPGLVTSPYAPTRGYVDVRGFPSGTEVKDPYTNKVFLAP